MNTEISDELRAAIRLHPERQYRLAQKAGIHPSTLSKLLNGIQPVRDADPRVFRLGAILRMPRSRLFKQGRR